MSHVLGRASRAQLQGVHPDLVAIVERAIARTAQDFSVHDGLRTEAELKTGLIWGGVWDRAFLALPGDAAGLEKAVNAYVARRRGLGKTAFIDGPHFELAR